MAADQQERVAQALFYHANAAQYKASSFPRWEWLTDKIKSNWLKKAEVAIEASDAKYVSELTKVTEKLIKNYPYELCSEGRICSGCAAIKYAQEILEKIK